MLRNTPRVIIVLAFSLLLNVGMVGAHDSVEHCYQQHPPAGSEQSLECIANIVPADAEEGLQGFTPPEPGEGNTTCGGVAVSVDVGCDPNAGDPISGYLSGIINFLAGGVVVVVTAMIVMGGFQYIWAHGSPDLIQKAKKQITNAVIALLTFIFIYAFLQWLIPGGLFNAA